MITDKVIEAVEASLDTKWNSHIVPEGEAYPTAGTYFIKVRGDTTEFTYTDGMVDAVVIFELSVAARTRAHAVHNKRTPYLNLINLQEQLLFHITSIAANDFLVALANIPGVSSTTGRVSTSMLRTAPTVVGPTYFNSQDTSSIREAGYVLAQTYRSPTLHIKLECLEIDNALISG